MVVQTNWVDPKIAYPEWKEVPLTKENDSGLDRTISD